MDDRSLMKKVISDNATEVVSSEGSLQGQAVVRARGLPSAEILPLKSPVKSRIRRPFPPKVRVEEHIGRQLQSLYNDVLAQAIPDRFVDLLQQLEARAATSDEDAAK